MLPQRWTALRFYFAPLRWRAALTAGLMIIAGTTRGADVLFYSVVKGQYYTQTDAGDPQLRPYNPYFFTASVLAVSNNSLNSVFVNLPVVGSRGMSPSFAPGPYSSRLFRTLDRVSSKSNLDSTFRSGIYTLGIFPRNAGLTNVPLSLPADQYPNIPRLTNWAGLQQVDAAEDLQLSWEPMTGGTTNDLIELQIINTTGTVFRTGLWLGESNALNGAATSVILPANTLRTGRMYVGKLLFQKHVVVTSNYAPGYAGYARQTDFYLATIGAGELTPPDVTSFYPADGTTGIPVNAPVIVTFNRPMGTGFNISYSSATNSLHTTFSTDRRSCSITPLYPWPTGTTITFTLNVLQNSLNIGDTNNTPLLPDRVVRVTYGSTTLATNPVPPMLAGSPRLGGQNFQFDLQVEPYRAYVLQSSTNLNQWSSLGTNYSTGSLMSFNDLYNSFTGNRFYRVLALPLP